MLRILALNMCLLVVAAGCGGSSTATVGGSVRYQGQPLNSGRVYFNVEDGKAVRSAEIQRDGSYSVTDLPEGEACIAVVVPPAPASIPSDPSAPVVDDPGVSPVAIPAKYGKVETSGLILRIQAGRNSHDIHLE